MQGIDWKLKLFSDTSYLSLTVRLFYKVLSYAWLALIFSIDCVNLPGKRPSSAHRRDENINTIVKRDTNWNRRDSRTFRRTRCTFNQCKKKYICLTYCARASPIHVSVLIQIEIVLYLGIPSTLRLEIIADVGNVFWHKPRRGREKEERQNEWLSEQNERAIDTRVTRARKSGLSILVRCHRRYDPAAI